MIEENSKLQVEFKGGGSITSLPPVFSQDAQYVYVAWKNQIVCYSTKTAKRVCEFKGFTQRIIGFGYVCAQSVEYIIACANNGNVMMWKANNALKLKEVKMNLNKHIKLKYFKIFCQENIDHNGIKSLVCSENKLTKTYEFSILNLENSHVEQLQLKLPILEENKLELFIDVNSNGQYFAVVSGQNMYYNKFGSKHVMHTIKGRTFTCVACHPTEVAVLTGDNTGRILLWRNIAHKNPTQSVFHWHTLPVETVCFSTSGTYFYSGAEECVLVKWEEDNNNLKKFLPRLPAPIKHVCVAHDNLYTAVATKDNGIQIVNPHLQIINVIQHLVLCNDSSAGITFDSRSKTLIMNGVVGHIQLFSPKDMNFIYSLDVVGQNKFTKERDKDIINTIVAKAAIDSSGMWMATVEHRCDQDMFECRLKFWFFDVTKQIFSLNTSIEYPHEDIIKDVLFQPSRKMYEILCVTIGEDKKFKVWQLVNVSTIYHKGYSWRCSGEVSYKDLTPHALSFSNDGSLIAVGFESTITTWLSANHELKCSLRHPLLDDNIVHLSFGNGSDCHLVFVATSSHISVWNLLSLSMTWTVRVDVSLVISDISTSFKSVFTKDKKVFVVDMKSADPVYSSKKVLKDVADVQAAAFVPKTSVQGDTSLIWHKRLCIYFLDSEFELYSIETKSRGTNFDLHIEDTNATLYSHLLPKTKTGKISKSNMTHIYQKGNSYEKFQQFINTPPQSMAPLHLTCEGLLQSMILECQKVKYASSSDTLVQEQQQENENSETSRELEKQSNLSKLETESTAWITIF